MRTIFSLCTKFATEKPTFGFLDYEAFLCSVVLSVENAKKYLVGSDTIELYTDAKGVEIFESINVYFDKIYLIFDNFEHSHNLWAMSKIKVYSLQTTPFLHVDLDAYFFAPLPSRLDNAQLLVQSAENNYPCYNRVIQYFFKNAKWMPSELAEFYKKYGETVVAINAGVYGGTNLTIIHQACAAAFDTVNHPDNAPMFKDLSENHAAGYGIYYDFNILLEQYFSAVYFIEHRADLKFILGKELPYYTHLLSSSKRVDQNSKNLKNTVKSSYPQFFNTITALVSGN